MSDLKKEIAILKQRVKSREEELGERVKRIPAETVKAGTSAILPSFLQKAAPNGIGNILGLAFSLWRNKKNGKAIKENLVSTAKKIGTIAAVKGIFSFFAKRKEVKEQKELRRNK